MRCVRPRAGSLAGGGRVWLWRRLDDLGEKLTQTWFGALASVAVQPAGGGGDQVVVERNLVACDGGDQGLDRGERLADTQCDVDAVGVDSAEIRVRGGGQLGRLKV